ncbi:predicted protein [Plenodomus lingam JN3]|uniref:Predicted protein n=1 Tax=Leptosphaeria maculans (strain JN3 / isolate v23.1.3 / race Av1-4-5-6-7-8) TaxID=985895 RepID=E5R4L3_LEPMJ|nr:predicted protein [Plenodomus lingam JN3]CBX91981.1 predicted protein [Plenodomus lingam JN3]
MDQLPHVLGKQGPTVRTRILSRGVGCDQSLRPVASCGILKIDQSRSSIVDEEIMLVKVTMLDPQFVSSRQCPLTRRKIFRCCMTAVGDALYDEADDSALLTSVAEEFGADLMVFDPLICRDFGIELWYLPIESSKFRYNC